MEQGFARPAKWSLGKEGMERLWSSSCGHKQASPLRIVFLSDTGTANTYCSGRQTLEKINTSTTAVMISPQKHFGHEDSGENSKANMDQS